MMLTLICGMPNAGKTTYSKQFANVIHLDDVGRPSKVADMVRGMTGDVVVEGVFGMPRNRMRLVDAYDGPTRCIFLDVPFDEILRREDRGRAEWLLRNAAKHFTPPAHDEGWDEIEVIRP